MIGSENGTYCRSLPFSVTLLLPQTKTTLGKSNHFSGQQLYSQVIKLLNKKTSFQQLTERGVIYVTKMKKLLNYTVLEDTMYRATSRHRSYAWQDDIAGGSRSSPSGMDLPVIAAFFISL